jgi:hypothetical protein
VLVHVPPTFPPGVTHLHVPLTQVWLLEVQLSVQELQVVLVPRVTQVPLQQVVPPEQALPLVPQTHWPLRQASATLPLQEMQAVPKPLVPQVAVDSAVRQVPLWQQPLRQVVASQVGLVQAPLTQVPLQQVWPPGQQI